MTQNNQESCSVKTGFDYCFWAKVLVAIPVLPTIAIAAASQFESEMSQGVAAVVAVIAVIALSRWLDRMPLFNKKINLKK